MLNIPDHEGNGNENHKEYDFIPIRMAARKQNKTQKIASVDEEGSEASPRALLVGL